MKSYYRYSFGKYNILQTPTLWTVLQNYNYMIVLGDRAWIIDPGDIEPIQKTLNSNELKPRGIYLTHHHQDHVGAATTLSKQYNCPVFGFEGDAHRLPPLDQCYRENDELDLGGLKARVLFFPGHTLGLCAFYIKEKNWLFSNDLLFSLGCGRIFEGSFKQMYESLKKLRELPDETLVFCSHEYTQNNLEFALDLFPEDKKIQQCRNGILDKIKNKEPTVPTLLSFEKEHNPFLRWDDPDLRRQLVLKKIKEVRKDSAMKGSLEQELQETKTLKTMQSQKQGLQIMEDWEVFAEIRRRKDQF